MSDDALIAGAAAPEAARRIRSAVVLDGIWVCVTATALIVSSRFALVDLPNQALKTGDAPLRVWVLGLPIFAVIVVGVAAIRRSATLTAAATGILAPPVAFTGSLSLSLFLDDDSAFADVGVAVSLGAAFVGVVMLLRWFVYHPADVIGDESRPVRPAALTVTGLGGLLGTSIVAATVGDDASLTAAVVLGTLAMLIVAFVISGAGLLRTRRSMVLAGAAAGSQLAGVAVLKLEQSSVPLDSRLALRSGVIGLVLCGAIVASTAAAWTRHTVDGLPDVADDDADWRWTADD